MTDLEQVSADLDQLREDVDYLLVLVEPSMLGTAATPPGSTLAPGPRNPGTATRPDPPTAHVWHALTVTEAAHAWTALTRWVDWLVQRYGLDDTLPECWYRHGAIVDELDALRAAWLAAYLDPAARAADPASWLDLLTRSLDRIRVWDRYGCAAGTHHEDTTPGREPARAHREREKFCFADVDARARARDHSDARSN